MGKQYVNPEGRIPMIGDWGRFYQAGELVIGCVQYIIERARNYPNDKQLCPDRGMIDVSNILEAR